MTTISFREAAILSHIAKQPKVTVSRQMSRSLGSEAKLLADNMIRDRVRRNMDRGRKKRARQSGKK